MQKNLVIVESPAKAKTIEKFLGKDYKVLSSYGHIRDLKKKEFSIDTVSYTHLDVYKRQGIKIQGFYVSLPTATIKAVKYGTSSFSIQILSEMRFGAFRNS